LAGDWIQDPPGPGGVPDEGWLLHHLRPSPPRPPGRRLIGKRGPLLGSVKTLAYKQGRGRGRGRGKGRGSGWGRRLKKTFIKAYLVSAFLLMALDVSPRKVVGDGELGEYNA
jgi:hypothetical protein